MDGFWMRARTGPDAPRGIRLQMQPTQLLMDLILAAGLGQLILQLARQPDLDGVRIFASLFVPLWWLWFSNVSFEDRFSSKGSSHWVGFFLRALPMMIMVVAIHAGRSGLESLFATGFVLGKLMLALQWWASQPATEDGRIYVNRFAGLTAFATIPWIVSTFASESTILIWWAIGLLLDGVLWALAKRDEATLDDSADVLSQRMGHAVLVASMFVVTMSLSRLTALDVLGRYHFVSLALLLGVVVALAWLYHDIVPHTTRRAGLFATIWAVLMHLVLYGTLAGMAVGALSVVGREGFVLLPGPARLLAWSAALALLCLQGISEAHSARDAKGRFKIETSLRVGAVVAAVAGLLGGYGALKVLGLVALAFLIPIVVCSVPTKETELEL